MALTAFNGRLGRSQGRVPSGDGFVFVLGDDEPGRLHELAPGDHAEVCQTTDLTDVDLVRAQLGLRVPANTPAGVAWVASILVDGVALGRATCRPGRKRVVTDLAANVSKMLGEHQVAVRLELVEV